MWAPGKKIRESKEVIKKEEKKKKERKKKKHSKITFNHREHPQQESQKDVAKKKNIEIQFGIISVKARDTRNYKKQMKGLYKLVL